MAWLCTAIRRDAVSFSGFLFRSQVKAFSRVQFSQFVARNNYLFSPFLFPSFYRFSFLPFVANAVAGSSNYSFIGLFHITLCVLVLMRLSSPQFWSVLILIIYLLHIVRLRHLSNVRDCTWSIVSYEWNCQGVYPFMRLLLQSMASRRLLFLLRYSFYFIFSSPLVLFCPLPIFLSIYSFPSVQAF